MSTELRCHGRLTRREERALSVITEAFASLRRTLAMTPVLGTQLELLNRAERRVQHRILYAMRSRPEPRRPSTLELIAAAESRLRARKP